METGRLAKFKDYLRNPDVLFLVFVFFLIILPGLGSSLNVLVSNSGDMRNVLSRSGFLELDFKSWKGIFFLLLSRLQFMVPLLILLWFNSEKILPYIYREFDWKKMLASALHSFLWTVGALFTLGLLTSRLLAGEVPVAAAVQDKIKDPLLILALVLVLIFNSLAEEFVFRSVLFEKLDRILKKPGLSVIILSLVFGSLHLYQGILPSLYIAVFGYILGCAYVKNREIVSNTLVHTVKNLLAVVLVLM